MCTVTRVRARHVCIYFEKFSTFDFLDKIRYDAIILQKFAGEAGEIMKRNLWTLSAKLGPGATRDW